MRSVVNHVADGIITIDDRGTVTTFNPAAERIFGYAAQEVIGQNIKLVMPEPYHSQHDGYLANYVRTGHAKIIGIGREVVGRRKDGTTFPLDLAINMFRLGQGRYFTGIVRDITERKRAEEALRESEERFRGTFENAAVGIAHEDLAGRFLRFNKRFCAILGYPPEELVGKTLAEVTHPEDLAADLAKFSSLARGELPSYTMQKRFIRKDRTLVWAHVTVSLQLEAPGKPAYCIKVIQDITDLKSAEDAVRQSEERFRGTFENAAVGIAHEDLAGRFLRFNKRFCAILGYPPEELVGKTLAEVTHPEDLAADLAKFGALTRGELPSYTMEKRFIRKDGTLIWAVVTVSVQLDAAQKAVYCIKMIQDISDRKRLETELQRAMEAAEAASRAKSEFLASMSHEIRTPMNGVFGMLDLALDTDLQPEQRHYLERARSSADLLLRVINDILDFSKIEAGRLDLEPAAFSLRESLGEAIKAFGPRAHRKVLELALHVRPDAPDGVVGDAMRLGQVLTNLLGNAIKFTDHGEVVLKVGVESVTERRVCLHFAVTDTGPGIPPDKQRLDLRRFRPGRQHHGPPVRRHGSGAGHLRAAGRVDGRAHLGRERGRQGEHLPLHGVLWPGPRRRGGTPRQANRPRRAARAGGG